MQTKLLKQVFFLSIISKSSLLYGAHRSHNFVFLEAGMQGHSKHHHEHVTNVSQNHKGWTGRVGTGTFWQVNDLFNFGIELGIGKYQPITQYVHLPMNSQVISTEIDRRALDFLLLGSYSYNSRFNFITKAGIAYLKQKSQTYSEKFVLDPIVAQTLEQDYILKENFNAIKRNRYLPKLAAGISYALTANQTLDIEYQYIYGNRKGFRFATHKKYTDIHYADNISIAWRYYF